MRDASSRFSHLTSPAVDAQTHTLVRQLQLLLPSVRIWLDVVNLENVSDLEAAVADAAVVIPFLSSGYFASKNCRREVYAALAETKPFVTVIELDKEKGGASRNATSHTHLQSWQMLLSGLHGRCHGRRDESRVCEELHRDRAAGASSVPRPG